MHADFSGDDFIVALGGFVARCDIRVGAGKIGIRLARQGVADGGFEVGGVHHAEGCEHGIGFAKMGHRLDESQMGVGVKDADLAREAGAEFRALENFADAAAIGGWAIHESCAVGGEQMFFDQREVMFCLFIGEESSKHRACHRNEAVMNAGELVIRVEQRLTR